MVRGRATGRGTRRGAAAASQRSQTESNDAAADATPLPTTEASGSASAADTPVPAPTRRGAPARATRAPAAGRFRPRNVRRDEAERDNLARQEEQKASERAAEERRARGRPRYRSKRSRGDTMGSRGGFGRVITSASGPLSSGMSSAGPSRSGGWFGGSGSGPASSKIGGSFSKSSKPGKGGQGFDVADSGYVREPRINADKLNGQTPNEELDSEDEAMLAALGSRATKVFPMGIYRREHKETGVIVITAAELEAAENATAEEESLWIDGQDPTSLPPEAQPEEQGVWETTSKPSVKVKREPGTEDPMNLDTNSAKSTEDEDENKELVVKPKLKKVLPQDPEDKMIQSDLHLLANELGAVTINEDGEAKTEGPTNKDGRMYLFQFPPLLPPLKPSSASQSSTKVKAEPQDVEMFDASGATGDPTPVDLTQEEMNADAEAKDAEDPQNKYGFMSELLSQGGMIGKLNVRKSGKVELDWGGRVLEMSPATGMNFLTTAVIVEENDEKPQHGIVGGESIGMGKIMGRFVLAPTWSEEEEWNVDPEELLAG